MTIRWSATALTLASRYIADQTGVRAINGAVAALALDPAPPEGFHRGRYHRLRVGRYRIMYVIDAEMITIERVDLA